MIKLTTYPLLLDESEVAQELADELDVIRQGDGVNEPRTVELNPSSVEADATYRLQQTLGYLLEDAWASVFDSSDREHEVSVSEIEVFVTDENDNVLPNAKVCLRAQFELE